MYLLRQSAFVKLAKSLQIVCIALVIGHFVLQPHNIYLTLASLVMVLNNLICLTFLHFFGYKNIKFAVFIVFISAILISFLHFIFNVTEYPWFVAFVYLYSGLTLLTLLVTKFDDKILKN